MAVAGDARARHRRVDQAAVPYRPNTRMGAQAAAIPPATPIRTDRPPRPQNDPAPLTRLGLGRAARRRVQAPASAPTPNRLTRGASGALPTTNHANPRASACPQSTPTPPRSGKNTTARPPDAQPTPRSTQPDTPKRPHRGTPGRLLQATRFGSYRKIEVGLGHVGLVLGIEVSRLARSNADWYNLMDLCALTDTLIADGDGVYHPAQLNPALVLGLKGTMAEAELHLIRQRLSAARLHKAAKGELRLLLPVGLDYATDGAVVLAGDASVRAAVAEVFGRFAAQTSARQVLLSLRADGLKLPRRRPGEVTVTWVEATYRAVHEILTKPAYAGAIGRLD